MANFWIRLSGVSPLLVIYFGPFLTQLFTYIHPYYWKAAASTPKDDIISRVSYILENISRFLHLYLNIFLLMMSIIVQPKEIRLVELCECRAHIHINLVVNVCLCCAGEGVGGEAAAVLHERLRRAERASDHRHDRASRRSTGLHRRGPAATRRARRHPRGQGATRSPPPPSLFAFANRVDYIDETVLTLRLGTWDVRDCCTLTFCLLLPPLQNLHSLIV